MQLATRGRHYVCLSCSLKHGRRAISTAVSEAKSWESDNDVPLRKIVSHTAGSVGLSSNRQLNPRKVEGKPNSLQTKSPPQAYASSVPGSIVLSPEQQDDIAILRVLQKRMKRGLSDHLGSKQQHASLTVDDALKHMEGINFDSIPVRDRKRVTETHERLARELERLHGGRNYDEVNKEIDQLSVHRRVRRRAVEDNATKELLETFGVLPAKSDQIIEQQTEGSSEKSQNAREVKKTPRPMIRRIERKRGVAIRMVVSKKTPYYSHVPERRKIAMKRKIFSTQQHPVRRTEIRETIANLDEDKLQRFFGKDSQIQALAIGEPKVPTLSFDLSRVLFNPGVYQLQDPRSRVFNFDPYLAKIMPVTEFNYDALNEYITSSQDTILRDLAKEHDKRYIGSSSSLSGVLQHFHFLLSAWREIDCSNLSRSFVAESKSFTKIHKSPSAIFMRHKDGVYAIDADKEYDSANILMSLGKSMEKLLTLEKKDFEKYKKVDLSESSSEFRETSPEQYHYGEIGQFLLRSQLDAFDSRLPGTGMFDLKTRAVAAVRMNMRNHESGRDYQIKYRFGAWESFEREYYDMIRSAFLKYSLQVRMGRMDGVFVAYHNTQRIFGFQYVSLPELDLALHGQTDRSLGDQEFGLSIKLLNDIFNRVTMAFPGKTLRVHVETREPTSVRNVVPYMYVFAEPLSEEEADRIQQSKKEEIADFERRLFSGVSTKPAEKHSNNTKLSPSQGDENVDTAKTVAGSTVNTVIENSSASNPNGTESDNPLNKATEAGSDVEESNNLKDDVQHLLTDPKLRETSPLVAFKIVVRNRVNGELVPRPIRFTNEDNWTLEYAITELDSPKAWAEYTRCKNRRMTALDFSDDDDLPTSRYIRNLIEMSQKGAEWRKEMDELDAQRECVILYGDRVSDKTSDLTS